jgi:hypothetical protein
MTTHIGFPGLLAALLCGCARTTGVASQSETAEPPPVQTVCSILEPGAHFSDPHITVRGQFVGLVEGSLLKDSTCDSKTLLLSYVSGGPRFLFCESEQLTREFGCPGGQNGPIVTIRGVMSPGRGPTPETGVFAIEEIIAYESTRTGKAVLP